ncbi:hypothetical protein O7627_25120 [Solwaraspora sp. WMMD1047]|uniref:DUF6585 family protein n=1 Tax=Solwaraspora sp. WMMD1047 TaxID=3016102 RepID=UPI002417E328|nr:DUF6585 family protein [Solwaraspora sp. WMMD1047]MDG4832566.1 hypothetical protein [Solwaraspora sp. WMMD1047]
MPDPPQSIVDVADRIAFGRVERAFRPTYANSVIATVFFLGLTVLFGVATAAATKPVGVLVLAAVTAAALLATGWGVVDTWRLLGRRCYLCEGGLLVAERHARVTRTVAWTDIVAIWRYYLQWIAQDGPMMLSRCRLRLADGTRLNLEKPPLVDGEELGRQVERRSAHARLPQVLAELESAGRVAFGPLTLTSDGIRTAGGGQLSWSDITLVQLRRVRLRIRTHDGGQPVSVLARRIPNLLILLTILDGRGLPVEINGTPRG